MQRLAKILDVSEELLKELDIAMVRLVGRRGVLDKVSADNEASIERVLRSLGLPMNVEPEKVRAALRKTAREHEVQLLSYLKSVPGSTEFDKAAHLARAIAKTGRGFFLKKSYGEDILRKCVPHNLLAFLKYESADELLAHHDVTEIFSALRFLESDEWMHQTFEKAYSGFTKHDFEERDIEIKVLGPEWRAVAEKFVAKKHHNVSHLKEFGVIFLNPIKEDMPGKFVRDFALLLHYFHEIEFYSKLFIKYSTTPDFAEHLKALLRGDVKDVTTVGEGEWLIVQRYLFKVDPKDPRLFLPRVNPESMHWFRGERDLANLGKKEGMLDLEFWNDLDWVGSLFDHGAGQIVSFDLEDNAMSAVSAAEGKHDFFSYHQREALWTKIFMEYVGGELEMEQLLLDNFMKGAITFS
ncbi:MAG: hypothetical protein A2945_00655 [Candidatus Liptonbacteria bacterium RIFCSPLOWO2_01_FULL_52_25]|uniref:Uncharacterized protein n=1 Tax=Candidatus Liptonbacteria bacterium RIFCSPLOWO2_01_FULL_52_25 TaxID=1798650 RepID=A0A1G2CH82_9BACT|nr:MAG: hypothetical protein A2945_00655 [Candidatus Liptonbacteria bacterium RIFCSPLOWO2_01_FULL_52_25]